jgi:hypothetical protein
MPAARHSRRMPRAIAAGLATCAVGLAAAAPGYALPAGQAAAQHRAGAGAHQSAAQDIRANAPTSSLAGTTEANLAGITGRRVEVSAPDEGATTLAVILIAAGAMAAGASAGFAGGRRGVLRAH